MSVTETPIICFVGPSNSGKTTTIETLLTSLPQYNIGTVKFIHHPQAQLEPIGKDSQRFREAGAQYTFWFAPKETAVIISKNKRDSLEEIPLFLQLNSQVLPSVDFILSEGPRHPPGSIPVILTGETVQDLEIYSSGLENNPIIAIAGKVGELWTVWNNIPVFNVRDEDSREHLVTLIVDYLLKTKKTS